MMSDHVHMLISIPPEIFGRLSRWGYQGHKCDPYSTELPGTTKKFTRQQFGARGYHVSTVGRDEATIREYIRSQEKEYKRLEQLNLFK